MKTKTKLRLYEFGGFLASVLPLSVILALNWDRYVQSYAAGVKLLTGGLILVILLSLKVLAKLRIPSSVTAITVVMLLSYLLQAILSDLTLLCGAYLVGEILDLILFRRRAKALREALMAERAADATAGRVEELLKTYIGNGRV